MTEQRRKLKKNKTKTKVENYPFIFRLGRHSYDAN